MNENLIRVTGVGAVSPAGWGVEALMAAVCGGEPLEVSREDRGEGTWLCGYRRVAELEVRPSFFSSPRLRRAPWMAKLTAAAVWEAWHARSEQRDVVLDRVGVIFVAMNGSVSYSRRFFSEVMVDPATASPLLFPETVYNSLASHVSALMGWTGPNYTLVGDSAGFAQGIDMAAQWIDQDEADAVIVVSAEECDWVCAEALELFQKGAVSAEGAGAICLEKSERGVSLEMVTGAHSYSSEITREESSRRVRVELDACMGSELLVDSLRGTRRNDGAEMSVWADWDVGRLSPGRVLGEAYTVVGAWQCVAAVEAVRQGRASRALVPMTGTSERAMGVSFLSTERG